MKETPYLWSRARAPGAETHLPSPYVQYNIPQPCRDSCTYFQRTASTACLYPTLRARLHPRGFVLRKSLQPPLQNKQKKETEKKMDKQKGHKTFKAPNHAAEVVTQPSCGISCNDCHLKYRPFLRQTPSGGDPVI